MSESWARALVYRCLSPKPLQLVERLLYLELVANFCSRLTLPHCLPRLLYKLNRPKRPSPLPLLKVAPSFYLRGALSYRRVERAILFVGYTFPGWLPIR